MQSAVSRHHFWLKSAVVISGGFVGTSAYARLDTNDDKRRLNNRTFTPFALVAKQPVSSSSALFTLKAPYELGEIIRKFETPTAWSIEVKQPQLQIARSYTPLPPRQSGSDELRFLIRKERNGEVSNFLHRLPIGANIDLRGPFDELKLPQNIGQVVFLAGGTGIAPALQIAHALRDTAKVHILWANREREDCTGGQSDTAYSSRSWLQPWGSKQVNRPADLQETVSTHPIVQHLDTLKTNAQGRLQVDYFVDQEHSYITSSQIERAVQNSASSASPVSKCIIVSGPEGFIDQWAGPKIWSNGKQVQGPLGGELSRMKLEGWEVIKL